MASLRSSGGVLQKFVARAVFQVHVPAEALAPACRPRDPGPGRPGTASQWLNNLKLEERQARD
eukprot:2170571-Rhodomonas_salina.1